ncbi:protein CUSTOS-like isoform X2 [Pecten maximus]|uniref:protein CUSTOS-like isoform X2 n=1 Tax=Pecten maximus TaxID=6579 RepID=UPI001458004A|nr:protein CUSTOS-like isoform X2 [Pecten maximus]
MASDSDSDSSVEDETQRQRLLDAAIDINSIVKPKDSKERFTGNQSAVSRNRPIPNKPSKRPSHTTKHEEKNDLDTTPEFKAFVAKKLSQMLDQEVKEYVMENKSLKTDGYEDTGIRLCVGSSHHLKTDCNPEDIPIQRMPVRRKRVQDSSSDSSSENERLAAAAVSHDFIIKQSKVSIGSQDDQSAVIKATEAKSLHNGNDFVSSLKATDCMEEDPSKIIKQKKKKKKKKQKIKENC